MHIRLSLFGTLVLATAVTAARFPARLMRHDATMVSACATDSTFQRLAFWVGTWDVFDSTGTRYATQKVSAVLDACAVVAEWSGTRGDKGVSLSAFDPRAHEWKQMYTSNQVPTQSGVSVRKSDSSYAGPGIRFIPLVGDMTMQTRVTILPLEGNRAAQLFEDSRDGGRTWRLQFKAEHRRELMK